MEPGGAFRVLLCLVMIAAGNPSVPVAPPTDVEVTCRNLEVQVGWSYGGAHTHTHTHTPSSFSVTLKTNSESWRRSMERSTVERRYNLTPLVWSSEDLYMSTFWVEVTATVGAHRSQPATSNTFTFSIVETANLTCELEFPPLALLRTERLDASLTFRNPFHFYRELQQAQRTGSSSLRVTVTSQDAKSVFPCRETEDTCRHEVVFPEAAKDFCVTLDGVLLAGGQVRQIGFKTSPRICAAGVSLISDNLWLVVGVPLAVLVLLAAVFTVAIVVAKRSSPQAPPRAPQWPVFRKLAQWYASVSPEDICIVETVPRTSQSEDSGCSEDRSSHQERASGWGPSEDRDQDQDQDEDENEEQSSGYDRPQCLVDMGNGDTVIGYKD